MPAESLNYLFALARTGYRSEFFSDFGKVRKTSIQTSITKIGFFVLLFWSLHWVGESTLGVCGIAQRVKIFR